MTDDWLFLWDSKSLLRVRGKEIPWRSWVRVVPMSHEVEEEKPEVWACRKQDWIPRCF